MNKRKKHFAKFHLPVLIYLILIFALSSIPKPAFPETKIPSLDKFLHTIEYAVLGFLFFRGFKNSSLKASDNKLLLFSVIAATFYGITDEFHQYFVPNRSASLVDVLFDCIGSIAGSIIYRSTKHCNI